MAQFNPGDSVTWESEAAGKRVVKVGKVVCVVPPNAGPNRELRDLDIKGKVDGPGSARDHVSYVVRAAVEGRGNRSRLYWPRVAALKPVSK